MDEGITRGKAGIRAAEVVHSAAHDISASHPLATVGEGTVKSAILRALLEAGFHLIEGSANGNGKGKVLSLTDGVLNVHPLELPPMPALNGGAKRSSPDFRVTHPIQLAGEIQCRSVWGSQDALFSANPLNDLDRICSGLAHIFVFCSGLPLYRALLGEKKSTRGRKPLALETFVRLFPDVTLLGREPSYYQTPRHAFNSRGGERDRAYLGRPACCHYRSRQQG